MFRIVAIVVVALAAVQEKKSTYLHHVQAMLAAMRHHLLPGY
jgi:hypothetical protein